jgi:hypothetical protein
MERRVKAYGTVEMALSGCSEDYLRPIGLEASWTSWFLGV